VQLDGWNSLFVDALDLGLCAQEILQFLHGGALLVKSVILLLTPSI
jgi:hypothetical protein